VLGTAGIEEQEVRSDTGSVASVASVASDAKMRARDVARDFAFVYRVSKS